MTAEHNNIRKLIEAVNHPAAVLLHEWLKPNRTPLTLDVRGTGYEVITCRLHDGYFSNVINGGAYKHPRCFLFHPNAIAALRSELKVKISQQGQEQIKYFWPSTSLETMVRECQGEMLLSCGAIVWGA